MFDDISAEMCFTLKDIGFEGYEDEEVVATGEHVSKKSSRTPLMRCVTHLDILNLSMDPDLMTYTYDRLAEEYSWHVVESQDSCPDCKINIYL